MHFDAEEVSIEKEDATLTVAFGRNGGKDYVILSRSIHYDEQDAALGQDTVHLEINDQTHGDYGVVETAEIGNATVHFTFDAERLGLDPSHSPLTIGGSEVAARMEALEAAMKSLLHVRRGKEDILAEPVLSIRNLSVEIPTRAGIVKPVDGVSYDIAKGEILGVVGESGAGKSMAGNAVIGLLSPPAHISAGEIWLNGRRIDPLQGEAMRKLRGKEIGMIFQDPLTSLNPLLTVGDQLAETMLTHLDISKTEADRRAVAALEEVGIPGAADRIDSYPHEFSGGMRQRVVIALALCAEPSLVIADEPTTALDVSVQAQIIALLKRLCRERGTAVMLITHDMGVIAETADRVAVMYAGRLAELGPVRDVLTGPEHPYTHGLMASTPLASAGQSRLHQIPGSMPRLTQMPTGCAFNPRCPRVQDKCRHDPTPTLVDGRAACWFPMLAEAAE